MGTLGLETVLIGDVVDGVGDTIIGHEGEGSTDGEALVLVWHNSIQLNFYKLPGKKH